MKIVILTQYFLPEMGAPQNRLFDLAKGLMELGWEVSVVTGMPNYPHGKIFESHSGKFTQTDWIENIEVKRYWLYPSNAPTALPRILSMLSFSMSSLFSLFFIRKKKPDYLFVESPPLTLGFSGWILSILSKPRLIANISDLWPLSARELGAIGDGVLYRSLELLEKFIYKRAYVCTGQSQEIVDYISKITPQKTYLFRNGVDTKRFPENKFNPGKRNQIVYAGLLGVAQGILSICENINFHSLNTEFHIYGTGSEYEKIISFIKNNPDRGIIYKGVLTRDEIPTVISTYGGTLIPLIRNIYGAVPSKIYEAMAAGLPIIFSGEGEGAKIIEDTNAGWVIKPGVWIELQNCILEFSKMSDAKYFDSRERNRITAKKYFDRTEQISAFSSFLESKMR